MYNDLGPKGLKYGSAFMQAITFSMNQALQILNMQATSQEPGKSLIKKLDKFKRKNSSYGWMPKMLQGVFPLTSSGTFNGLPANKAAMEIKRRMDSLGFRVGTCDGAIRQTMTMTIRWTMVCAWFQALSLGPQGEGDLLSNWVEDFYDNLFWYVIPKPPGLTNPDQFCRYGEEVIDYGEYSAIFRGSFLLGMWSFRITLLEQTGGNDDATDMQTHYHEKLVSIAERIIMKADYDFFKPGKAEKKHQYDQTMKQLHQYIYPQCSCAWSRIAIWSRQNIALLYDADLDSIVGENALAYKANPKSQSGKKNLYVRSRIFGFSQMDRELSGEEDFWTNTLGFQLYQDKYPGWEGYDEEQHGYKHNTDAITAVAYRAAAQYKYDDEPEKRLFFWNAAYFAILSTNEGCVRSDFPHVTDQLCGGEVFQGFGMTRFYNLGYLRDLVKRAEEAGKKINRSYFNEKTDQKVDCEWLPRAILEICEGLDDLVDLPHVNRIVGKHSCYECVDPQTGKKHVWNEFKDRDKYLKREKGGVYFGDAEDNKKHRKNKAFSPFKALAGANVGNMWSPTDEGSYYFGEQVPNLSMIALAKMQEVDAKGLDGVTKCTDPKKAEELFKDQDVDTLIEALRDARLEKEDAEKVLWFEPVDQ